jgi:hypothetical protein
MISHNPGVSSGTLEVLVDGVAVGGTFTHNTPNSGANMQWQSAGVGFTVVSPTTELCFHSLTGTTGGPALDAVTVTLPAAASYATEVAADGPIAWYRLGEGSAQPLVDSAGSHNGTCVNGVTFGLPGAISADANTARGFDGKAAYCYANGIAAPTSAWTIEGWMKQSAPKAATIAEHGSSGGIYVTATSTCLRNAWETLCAPGAPSAGTWHHVAASWSASDKVASLYVDGVLRTSAVNGAKPSGSSTFYVGYGQSAPWFNGSLDEIAYYATRLSAARIAAHYHAGCGC